MDPKDFYDLLEKHDWFYCWSDDHRVYTAGEASRKNLEMVARGDQVKLNLLREYSAHMFSGKAWKTVQAPKPAPNKPKILIRSRP